MSVTSEGDRAGRRPASSISDADLVRLQAVTTAAGRSLAGVDVALARTFTDQLGPLVRRLAEQHEATIQQLAEAPIRAALDQFAETLRSPVWTEALQQALRQFSATLESNARLVDLATVSVTKDLTVRWDVEASIDQAEDIATMQDQAPADVMYLAILVLSLIVGAAGITLTPELGQKLGILASYLVVVAMIQQDHTRRRG